MPWQDPIVESSYEHFCSAFRSQYFRVDSKNFSQNDDELNFFVKGKLFYLYKEQHKYKDHTQENIPSWSMLAVSNNQRDLIGKNLFLGETAKHALRQFIALIHPQNIQLVKNYQKALSGIAANRYPKFTAAIWMPQSLDVFHPDGIDCFNLEYQEMDLLNTLLHNTIHRSVSGLITNDRTCLVDAPKSNHERIQNEFFAQELFSKTYKKCNESIEFNTLYK